MNSGPAVSEGFSRDDRLRKRREFEECYASGVRVSGRHVQVFLLPAAGARRATRLGISVPDGWATAVVRNRVRRRLREIFRRSRARSLRRRAAVARRQRRGPRPRGALVSRISRRTSGRGSARASRVCPVRDAAARVAAVAMLGLLQAIPLAAPAAGLPLRADLLGLRPRGDRALRPRARAGRLAAAAPASLPSVPPRAVWTRCRRWKSAFCSRRRFRSASCCSGSGSGRSRRVARRSRVRRPFPRRRRRRSRLRRLLPPPPERTPRPAAAASGAGERGRRELDDALERRLPRDVHQSRRGPDVVRPDRATSTSRRGRSSSSARCRLSFRDRWARLPRPTPRRRRRSRTPSSSSSASRIVVRFRYADDRIAVVKEFRLGKGYLFDVKVAVTGPAVRRPRRTGTAQSQPKPSAARAT